MNLFQGMTLFAEVVASGSFTRAAAALKLSKSTVSEGVRNLEARLGTRLLDRTTRALTLTEAGRIFHARALRAIEEARSAHAEIQAYQAEPAGHLRIGAPEGFSDLRIVPALPGFFARYPKITIEILESAKFVSLVELGLDLAIRIAPDPEPNLVVRRIGISRVLVCASPAYLKRAGHPRRPENIAEHHLIGFGPLHWAHEWRFAQGDSQIAVPVRPRLVAATSAALRAAALGGLGLVAIPDWAVAPELARRRLVTLLDDWKLPESGIYAVYPTNRLTTPKAKLFADHFARAMRGPGA